MLNKAIRGFAVLGGFAVVLFAFAPAVAATSAGTPAQFVFTVSGDFPWPTCGAFTFVEAYTALYRGTVFYDSYGNAVSLWVHTLFRGLVTNPLNGLAVDDWADAAAFMDLTTGGEVVVGVLAHVTIPGYGIVWHDAGRVVMTIAEDPSTIVYEAGFHEYWNGEISEVCAAMA